MSEANINTLMTLWASSLVELGQSPPFANADDLHDVIDSTTLGDAPWHSFFVRYNGEIPSHDPPPWMTSKYEVWFRDPHDVMRNIFSNPDFKNEIDYTCYREFTVGGERCYKDFMSGNWAWRHSVSFSQYLLATILTHSRI